MSLRRLAKAETAGHRCSNFALRLEGQMACSRVVSVLTLLRSDRNATIREDLEIKGWTCQSTISSVPRLKLEANKARDWDVAARLKRKVLPQ